MSSASEELLVSHQVKYFHARALFFSKNFSRGASGSLLGLAHIFLRTLAEVHLEAFAWSRGLCARTKLNAFEAISRVRKCWALTPSRVPRELRKILLCAPHIPWEGSSAKLERGSEPVLCGYKNRKNQGYGWVTPVAYQVILEPGIRSVS